MIQTYRLYMSLLNELFIVSEQIQKCTDDRKLPRLVFVQTEIIQEVKMLRSILNQKECELFVNGENQETNFN